MKVSVITVCFNSETSIGRTIESVRQQTYDDIEYVVVDGGSTDATNDIVRQMSEVVDSHISEADQGIYDAMNKGVRRATGDVITFLNSDDVFSGDHVVESAVKALRERKVDLVFGDVLFFEGDRVVRHYSSKTFKAWKLRFGWMPPHPGSFAKRRLYENYGLFTTKLSIASDYEMFVRWLLVKSVSYARMDRINVNMAVGGASTESLVARLKLNREIVSACKMNNVYTNLLLVLTKIPFKLMELFIKPSRKMSI